MKKILLYLWQLPQNLLGLLLRSFLSGEDAAYEDAIVRRTTKMPGGISLGKYIILNKRMNRSVVMHEYGHCRQSKMLGWLYLIVIGLPSLLHAKFCKCKDHDYRDYWCEKWADKLGGVKP